MKSIIIVAETGSDVSKELAMKYGIKIVPMHVLFDQETLDDGKFPVKKICDYYETTGKLPKTSGCTPNDFNKVFDQIHSENPEAQILYLAYSAVTTCSYQSALIAADERDYVTLIDTKQVSFGQGKVVIEMAKILQKNPGMTIKQAAEKANELCMRTKMCFIPDDLEFLRTGGRVSNAVCLGSRILSIHPCIEVLDGTLVVTKKYRGKMTKVVKRLIKNYSEENNLNKECLWLGYTIGLPEEVQQSAEEAAKESGFKSIEWVCAGGVITTHGGPAAFGIVGFSE